MVDGSLLSAGQQAEMLALNYLKAQGLRPLKQNFHCRFGEIDLIMQEKDAIIFVEVKYRRNSHFGGGLAAITPGKQRKLKLAASHYLQRYQPHSDRPCRFDAVVIEGNLNHPHYQWITHILQ
jgi:putative endonuclease